MDEKQMKEIVDFFYREGSPVKVSITSHSKYTDVLDREDFTQLLKLFNSTEPKDMEDALDYALQSIGETSALESQNYLTLRTAFLTIPKSVPVTSFLLGDVYEEG